MAEHSPTPWRVSESPNGGGGYFIEHAGGYYVADVFHDADAAYIVEAVNNYEVLIQERRRLIGELDSVKAQLDWHKRQLKAVKSDAESEERWANQYFEQAQNAEAEVDRLRDIVRRLADALDYALDQAGGEWQSDLDSGSEPNFSKERALIREAREALGEVPND